MKSNLKETAEKTTAGQALSRSGPRVGHRLQLLGSESTQTSDREFASKVKRLLQGTVRRSRRNGCWFGLSQIERSICTLTLRLDVRFKSWALLKAVVSILKKLKEIGDRLYVQMTRGLSLAWRFSTAAVEWGNAEAKAWRNDIAYARYLGAHMTSGGPRS